ncbi:MAG: hypothetical protein AAF389_14360 [Gemmatimonadota bacterium]
MANLADNDEEGISLFPMFNILACTLGVMVFILATVATVNLGADRAVELVANIAPGEPETREPLWLEWDGVQLGVVPNGPAVTFGRDLRSISTWTATHEYISATIAGSRLGVMISDAGLNAENQYIVLLVRPSGFRNFLEVQSYFEFLGLEVGYEPIRQEWQRVGVR